MPGAMQTAIHILTAIALPPLLIGVIAKTKALFAGRVGPPLLQPYFDLAKLIRKGTVLSHTASWVFLAGPVASLATTLLALMLIPLGNGEAPISFQGDLILLAYLLGLGRFLTALAALDVGSSFEGMGAAREVAFACLAEPALFLGLTSLVRISGSLQLSQMLGGSRVEFWQTASASMGLVALSWFVVLLAENCRIPFDDPNTHLELTMVHEVMVLDHSGPAYGMILYAAALKLFLFCSLLVCLFPSPSTGLAWLDWGFFMGGVFLVAAVVGVVESSMARLRLAQTPLLLAAACLLSSFGIVLLAR